MEGKWKILSGSKCFTCESNIWYGGYSQIGSQITPNNYLHSISSRKLGHTKYSANIAKGLYMGKYPVSTISLCVETSIQRRKFSFLRYSLPWQRDKHTRLPRKKSLIDVHNISKYHFLQISWSKDINFLMLSIQQDCKIFSSNWRPGRLQFSGHFTKKATDSALISLIFVNFNKCRLKKSMVALVPPIGTKNPIFGVSAHGLCKVLAFDRSLKQKRTTNEGSKRQVLTKIAIFRLRIILNLKNTLKYKTSQT